MEKIELEPVHGHCFTNLDYYECDVNIFTRCPNIGERVAVRYKGQVTSLKICQITHSIKEDKPYIKVELHN